MAHFEFNAGAEAVRHHPFQFHSVMATRCPVFLAASSDDKVTLIAGMSKTVVKQGVKAGDLIKEIAPIVGGRGGGRPDMAQGGGNDPSAIPQAIKRAKTWLNDKL